MICLVISVDDNVVFVWSSWGKLFEGDCEVEGLRVCDVGRTVHGFIVVGMCLVCGEGECSRPSEGGVTFVDQLLFFLSSNA